MAFVASLTELAAVTALKSVYAFLHAMPARERYDAAMTLGGRANDAASVSSQVFWMIADELVDTQFGGKKSKKLAEQLLSILLNDSDLLASIAPAIAGYVHPTCVPPDRDEGELVANAVPLSVMPLVARKRTRPSNSLPASQ